MADALAPATVPPPRKRSFAAKLLRTLLVLVLLLAVLAWFAPTIIARTALLNTILAKAAADLNGTVTADGASLGWFSPVELRGVTVKDTSGSTVLTADTVSSSRTLYQLITDRSDLGTFTVATPKLEAVVAGGTTNVETLIEKYLKDTTPPKPDRTAVKLELTGGTVVLKEPAAKLEHSFTALELSLAVPLSRSEAVSLTAAMETHDGAAPGKLKATAELAAGGKVKLVADSFAVGHLAPLLHRFDPNTAAAGSLTANLAATWKAEEKKPIELTVDGTASATSVRVVGLAQDPLALQSVSVPCKLSYAGGILKVEKASVTCDMGSIEFAGTLDPAADPEALAAQAGLKLKARIDVAKLAAALPKTLRLRPGTAFRSGTLSVDVSSTAGAGGAGPTWAGTVSTSPFEATRDGQTISWDKLLSATFSGRLRADKMPHFDNLEIRSDFLNVNARGEPEAFEAAARTNLGILAAKLGEFADLGGWKLNGDAIVRFQMKKPPGKPFEIKGSVSGTDVLIADGAGVDVREPKVFADYWIDFERQPDAKVRLDRAEVGITIGTDKLAVTMLKPVPDVRGPFAAEAAVTLIGDLVRWRSRIGPIVGLPVDWTVAGKGTITATAGIDPTAFTATKLGINLADVAFQIPKMLDVNEKQLIAKADMRFDRKAKAVALTGGELTSATVGATIPNVTLTPRAGGGYGVTGTGRVDAQLEQLQRTLLLRAPDGSDALSGRANGTVTFDTTAAGRVGFAADLTVKDFAFGPPAKPTHTEQLVKVKASGAFDSAADTLTLAAAHVDRDGLAVDAAGSVAKLSTTVAPNLSGTITYDLAKVEPTVKEYLGASAQVSGKGTKPFRFNGELLGGAPGTGTDVRKLAGEATVGWQSVKAYGFDVGAADLGGTLKDGIVYFSPVNATFGGGKVAVTPGLSLRAGERFLNFGKGKIVDTAKLTPAACADAIGFALPAIANAAQADGTFSFDLDDSRIPLAVPATGTVSGRLTVHQANVSPGPVITQVLQALKVANTTVTLSKNNVVPIEFKNGRVYHRDFTMSVDGIPIKTAGSVGVDGTVSMEVEVPLSGKVAGQLLPNNPRMRDALSKQSLRIPIGGTLGKPTLDFRKYEAGLAKLIQDASRDAGSGLVEDVIKKGADDLFKKLLPKK